MEVQSFGRSKIQFSSSNRSTDVAYKLSTIEEYKKMLI